MEDKNKVVAALLTTGFMLGVIFALSLVRYTYISVSSKVKSKQRIKPDLVIEVKNEVSDTTYIYYRK